MMENGIVSSSDWFKGIGLSILASVVGGASKLAIRKSWLMAEEYESVNSSSEHGEIQTDTRLSLDSSSNGQTSRNSHRNSSSGGTAASTDEENNSNNNCNNNNNNSTSTERRATSSWIPYCLRYSGMFGMSVLNPICCVLAMNYASPSILAPFSGLTLVWVILFSQPVVGEKPSRAQVIAASLIVTGEVVVATFGDHTNDEGVTIEDVRKSYSDPSFIAYLVGLCLYLALLAYWILFSKSPLLRRFAWGSLGGSMTGLQNFLKDSLTIVKAVAAPPAPEGEPDDHYPWFFYLFVIMAAASAFGGLLVLTACMKRYDATYSAASFVGAFVISASFMSAAHYKTFIYLEGLLNYILYPVGLLILMVGVYLLVRESKDEGEEEDEEEVIPRPVRKNSEDSMVAFAYAQVGDDESSNGNDRVV